MKKSVTTVIYALAAVLMVFIDQISKNAIVKNLKGKENLVLINKVFELEYVENDGAAFSSFAGKQGFLLLVTVLILLAFAIEFVRIPEGKRYTLMRIDFVMIIAGAVGNMIDRVKQGYVVDFFYFVPINFPRFNVADIYVTLAMVLLIVLIFAYYKDEEIEFLFKFKK